MLYNHLKIAYRNLVRYRFISFINLFGLTIGLTCCLLILTYILNEISYDRFHKNADNIYRIQRTFLNPDNGSTNLSLGAVAPPFAPLLENDFKEIKKITRLLPNGNTPLKYEDKIFNEQNAYFADENLFDVFDLKLLKGNPAVALDEPFSVMMTKNIAEKYFGDDDPMDKMIRLDNLANFKVTGIFKDFPSNSHLHPEILLSFNTLKDSAIYGEEQLRTNWGNNSFFTYLLLPEDYNPERLETQFPAFLNRHLSDGGSQAVKPSDWTKLDLIKLTDIHLRSHRDLEAEENGDIKRVYIFSAIGLFILLIACINYMNLSTARSALRAREIGVRKVIGAERKELIFQFLTESVLLTWIATLLAIILSWLLLPWLNELSGQALSLDQILRWEIVIPAVLVPFIVGISSGIYPALFMSSFKPVKVLKGFLKAGDSNISFRKILVVTQFAISIILIISTVIVFRQLDYISAKSLGFIKEHTVTMNNNTLLSDNYNAFYNELLSNAHIKNVARSSRIPSMRLLDASGSQIRRNDSMAPTNAEIKQIAADNQFMSSYGIRFLAGRNFSNNLAADTNSFIINQAAAEMMQLSNTDVIGKAFQYGSRQGTIIGVVSDFHFESMHQRILPMVFLVPRSPNGYGRLSVKINGENINAGLAHLENTWKKYLPETPFEYTFLDESFQRLYQTEQRQGTIFSIFACVAIFIACLGLFGLSAFSISQRIKEIGVRKVLGATTTNIVTLISREFIKLVVIASCISFPVSWYIMNAWLLDFAYRTNIPWWAFAIAAFITVTIALATVGVQAVRAAISNPVKSLRSE